MIACLIQAQYARSLSRALKISGDNGLSAGIVSDKLARCVRSQGLDKSGKQQNGALAGAALLLALALGGCATSISEMSIGSASSDNKPKEAGAYLPVNELPPAREEAAMPVDERAKVQKELIAAREHQASAAAAKGQAPASDQNQAQGQAQNQAQAAK